MKKKLWPFISTSEKLSSRFCYTIPLKSTVLLRRSLTLFEVLIQTENILFLNTINILIEYRYNSYIIYQ